MSSHPSVDTYISTKQTEINEEYENILNLIEEKWNEHKLDITNVNNIVVTKLIKAGFKVSFFPSISITW